ncbi:MAG: S8 family serine peptidase, partial [Chloroflexales bacterium]|nr:S8 family serine peptidase [Chloroflexales bacterium]
MIAHLTRMLSGVIVVTLSFSLLSNLAAPQHVLAQADNPSLPTPDLVEAAPTQVWTQRPAIMPDGPVAAIVHTNMLPLGALAFSLSPQQRALYARQVSLVQDRLAQQIEALGGVVRGRFLYASTGLAVDIDVNRTRDVLDLRGVQAVRSVAQYELDLSDTMPWIGAATLQNEFGGTGQGVSIAIIDTGVDYTHAKLGGPGTKEAYNLAYCGDPAIDPFDPTTGVCAPAYDQAAVTHFPNAKVAGGHDYVGEVWPSPDPRCGFDTDRNPLVCIVPDPNPIDFHGHGTHVADIAAGLSSNQAGEKPNPGVAPGADIWSFKACSALTGMCDGLALLLALDDAMDLDGDTETYDPADVINLSLGKLYGQPEDDLTLFVNMASYYGSLVVTAAGNNGDRPY